MKTRRPGANGPEIPARGLGCSGVSHKRPRDDVEGHATLSAALDAGIDLSNTADFHGSGHNESLLGGVIADRREHAFVNVKCGALFDPSGRFIGIDGRPKSIKNFAAYALQRLGVKTIDLFQPCRIDTKIPYEDTRRRHVGRFAFERRSLRTLHDVDGGSMSGVAVRRRSTRR